MKKKTWLKLVIACLVCVTLVSSIWMVVSFGESLFDAGNSNGGQVQSAGNYSSDYSDLIELSNGIKNGVNTYYTDASKTELAVTNQNMSLKYGVEGMSGSMQVNNLTTPDGKPYIQNTMDIVLNMKNGKSYYASRSIESANMNIFRYGYYYYETRIEGQNFINDINAKNEYNYNLDSYSKTEDIWVTKAANNSGILSYRIINTTDPRIHYGKDSFSAADYDYLEFKMRVSEAKTCSIYLSTDTAANQKYDFTSVAGDEFVTYTIPLKEVFSSYSGTVTELRFDINGSAWKTVEFSGIRVYKASYNDAPETVALQRSFHTYSDKLHHLIQLSTETTIADVASVEMVTKINADTVNAIVVKDASGWKYTLEGVDWATAQYVGFDIKDAGVFGYILPVYNEDAYGKSAHVGSGTLKVTLSDGVYTVTQTKIPTNNKLIPSASKTANANDFYMGQRIYTDLNHDFAEFIKEAENERHPLTAENIVVDTTCNEAEFVSYDPLRGSYVFTLSGSDFNKSYYIHQNRQYRVKFTVTGDDRDRQTYFMTHMSDSGGVESAVLLGEGDLLLPVPMEVCKNFGGDGDKTIFDLDDFMYSEVYFPMIIDAGETKEYTVVHAYQNWGVFPLKQISSIEYHQPFYHLSTGVTETNCIVPFPQAGPGLSDHRAMSAPFWGSQPQHTSGGGHVFMHFTNEQGKAVISNTTDATIDSHGPTYSDITLDYISSDDRIKATYTHMEMPQTDENRAYYEMTYTFLEDVSFTDFVNQFKFYRCTDNDATGWYQRIGYLDKNNNYQVASALHDQSGKKQKFVLGNDRPYFTFFDMADCSPDDGTHVGYVNISFLINNYQIIQNGVDITSTTNFAITNYSNTENDFIQLSLDLGKVTFKKGDTIKINAILMPWGSHLLNDGVEDVANGNYEYTTVLDNGEQYMDKNVRDVRENSLGANLFKATANNNCTVLANKVFLPEVKTTNGQSAEFTLSGGNSNSTVRVYGFDKLTVPVIEEYVDGQWVAYNVASINKLDDRDFGYYYDGYMVYYDEDGTYSYSFVVDMDNGAERKFRISAADDFTAWSESVDPPYGPQINAENDPINVYVDAAELRTFEDELWGRISGIELLEDDGTQFVRFNAHSGATETILNAFSSNHNAYADLESTGQYAVIKYRLPSTIPTTLKNIQFFASTVNESALDNSESWAFYDLKYDDQWHVVVFDVSTLVVTSKFDKDANGVYNAKYLRIDIFNEAGLTEDHHIDFAYVGMCDNMEDIYELNKDMDNVTLVTKSRTYDIDPSTGTMYNGTPLNLYLDANDIYDMASVHCAGQLTSIDLFGDGAFVRMYANSEKNEAYAKIYDAANEAYKYLPSTGKYIVFKYRLPSTHASYGGTSSSIQFYTYTEEGTALNNNTNRVTIHNLKYDDQWHVVVVDATAMVSNNEFKKGADGSYKALYLRFDFLNGSLPNDYYIDYAYIGMCDDLIDAYAFNYDDSDIQVIVGQESGGGFKVAGDATGDTVIDTRDLILLRKYFASYDYNKGIAGVGITNGDANGDGKVSLMDIYDLRRYLVSSDYGDFEINSNYRIHFNKIVLNGTDSLGATTSINAPAVIDLGSRTLTSTGSITFSGWFMAESGIAEYKYRIIGNETKVISFGKGDSKTVYAGDGAYKKIADDLGLSYKCLNGVTMGGDRTFDLTGYEGQTVTVELIAVTNNGREIVAARFINVNVP